MRTNLFLPVIHVLNLEQSLENAKIAFDNGADGIFLINHDRIFPDELLITYALVRKNHPERWIGLNLLRLPPEDAIEVLPISANALWIDDAGVVESLKAADRTRDLWALVKARKPKFEALLFGGVAFKYVHESTDPARDARVAAPYLDVVTTSGNATGEAPSLKKIRAMRETLELESKRPHRTDLLAIASGMTPENVSPYLELVDYFLVATGISKNFHELDPIRVRMMADKMCH